MIDSLAQGLDALALFLFLAFTFSAIAACFPVRKGDAVRWELTTRYQVFLPPLAASLVVLMGFGSAFVDAMGGLPDHCGVTNFHQPTLCYMHPTGATGLFFDELATLALVTGFLAMLAVRASRAVAGHLALARLECVADEDAARGLAADLDAWGLRWPGPISVLPGEAPICFVHGVFRPRLVLSAALLRNLTDKELGAVIAHEQAHALRHDPLWRLAGSFMTLLHLPVLGRRAFARWTLASEALCDEQAARTVGSRIVVAEALVRYQRLLNQHVGPLSRVGVAFAGTGVLEVRVRRLLAPAPVAPRRLLAFWPWAALAAACLQADGIHTLLEAVLHTLHQ